MTSASLAASGAFAPIAIAGPTASGKTAAALAIAALYPCEIISVDSALIYQGMDIGTAKPSAAQLSSVPHHLIDILDPRQSYSVAAFAHDAIRLIADIQSRGKLPLLVGGTMLYFKALMLGLDDMPVADLAIRAEINVQAARLGWPALHAELAKVDAVTAARLAPNDAQRISRALEVFRSAHQPLSYYHRAAQSTRPDKAQARPLAEDRLISFEPQNRAWLHTRIALRFDDMLAQGFMKELFFLRARGDLHLDLPSMRCVGYRQAWQMLDDNANTAESLSDAQLSVLRERCTAATRQLAKRQITWLRAMPRRRVVYGDDPAALAQALATVESLMSSKAV